MSSLEAKENQEKWLKKVKEWKATGLSAKQWCKRENIAVSTFHYWIKKYDHPNKKVTNKPSKNLFVEISSEEKISDQITVKFQDVDILLESGFNKSIFSQLITTLREISC